MKTNSKAVINKSHFGKADGQDVYLFTCTNSAGDEVKITNYGGIVTSWITTDKNGNRSSVVVGFGKLEQYIPNDPHFGAIVGRYANRIAKGKFSIGTETYNLATNNGPNSLHGGLKNFSKVVWTPYIDDVTGTLELSYVSKDGEEGFPGNLTTTVSYRLTDENQLIITYAATTDKATVINLTNHSYFNLTGNVNANVMDHIISINANRYTPVDDQSIPTGKLESVIGTPFDLTTPQKIGAEINNIAGGYDHNYVLNDADLSMSAATVTEKTSGRKLEVFTDEPGIQLYTGNSLDGTAYTDDGKPINRHCAFCLETQHFPDSPNHSSFPSTLLHPGEEFHATTIYKISLA